jgi:hypothetical protein
MRDDFEAIESAGEAPVLSRQSRLPHGEERRAAARLEPWVAKTSGVTSAALALRDALAARGLLRVRSGREALPRRGAKKPTTTNEKVRVHPPSPSHLVAVKSEEPCGLAILGS